MQRQRKVAAGNARHLASQHVRLPVPLATRSAQMRIISNLSKWFLQDAVMVVKDACVNGIFDRMAVMSIAHSSHCLVYGACGSRHINFRIGEKYGT